jgi:hypothetical protein
MSELARYDAMCRAIDAAYEVDEAKGIRDQAIALEVYARQAHNTEAERRACEIRLRAERKAGAISAKLEKAQGQRTDKLQGAPHRSSKTSQLRDAGVSPDQAKQWEKLAAVPQEKFDAALADSTTMPTTASIIRATIQDPAKPKPPTKQPVVSAEALWLWGRLRDFERDGLLDKKPAQVMATMTSEMRDDVHTLAPPVARWLQQIGLPAASVLADEKTREKTAAAVAFIKVLRAISKLAEQRRAQPGLFDGIASLIELDAASSFFVGTVATDE